MPKQSTSAVKARLRTAPDHEGSFIGCVARMMYLWSLWRVQIGFERATRRQGIAGKGTLVVRATLRQLCIGMTLKR